MTAGTELGTADQPTSRPPALGRLVTFEGIDGAGKTTQLKRTEAWLTGSIDRLSKGKHAAATHRFSRRVQITREPGGTDLGGHLRQLLLSPEFAPSERTELLLYAADRAQHVAEVIRPALTAGWLVLSDRFVDSTVAYQGYGRGLDLDEIQQSIDLATGGLTSDLTLWFDVPIDLAIARRQARPSEDDRLEQSRRDFYERVRAGFTMLNHRDHDRVVRIEASGSVDEIFAQVQTVLGDRLHQWFG